MVGAAYATREGANISVDAFEQILKPKACFIYKNIGNAIFLASVLYLVYQSALYLRFTISTHAMATVTKLPLAYVYASLSIGFGLVTVRLCVNWYKLIREFMESPMDETGEVEE